MSAVDVYLADLRAAIPGPSWTRRDLLREAGDHLEDATDAYAAAGYTPAEAEALALRDFGSVDDIAPGFRDTVAIGAARRTALMLVLVMIPQAFLWDGGIDLASSAHLAAPDAGLFRVLDGIIEYVGTIGALGAVIALAVTAIGQRWLAIGRRTARLTATWTLAIAVVIPVIGFTMLTLTGSLTVMVALAAIAFMVTPFALVAASAQRTLAAC
ncbi:permease prefix domain 1-containing protein [Nocardioides sp. NPDC057767]|uniref:permease prefix domain 1-containing protein n=1 Tax=unclassified Nocardioides TaxID=2615069 RepID=UPI003672369F